MRDCLQERLKQMEEENPSLNAHPQGLIKGIRDRLYFHRRAVRGVVEEYTPNDLMRHRLICALAKTRHILRFSASCRASTYRPQYIY